MAFKDDLGILEKPGSGGFVDDLGILKKEVKTPSFVESLLNTVKSGSPVTPKQAPTTTPDTGLNFTMDNLPLVETPGYVKDELPYLKEPDYTQYVHQFATPQLSPEAAHLGNTFIDILSNITGKVGPIGGDMAQLTPEDQQAMGANVDAMAGPVIDAAKQHGSNFLDMLMFRENDPEQTKLAREFFDDPTIPEGDYKKLKEGPAKLVGSLEAMANLLSIPIPFAASAIPFVGGAAKGAIEGKDFLSSLMNGAQAQEEFLKATTYQPKTAEGEKQQKYATMPFEGYRLMAKPAAEYIFMKTGSPAWATITHTIIEGLPFYAALLFKDKPPKDLAQRVTRGIEADINSGELSAEQIREMWKDPANREALLRKYAGVEKEPKQGPPPEEPPAAAGPKPKEPPPEPPKGPPVAPEKPAPTPTAEPETYLRGLLKELEARREAERLPAPPEKTPAPIPMPFTGSGPAIPMGAEPPKGEIVEPGATSKGEAKAKEPWEMTRGELEKARDWGAEPMAAIPGEPIEFIGKDWDNSPAALFNTPDGKYTIRRDDGTSVYNPKTKTEFFDTLDVAWDEYHKQEIKQALSEGKPVPPEVLADYPDIQGKVGAEEVNPENVTAGKPTNVAEAKAIVAELVKRKSDSENKPETSITSEDKINATLEAFKKFKETNLEIDKKAAVDLWKRLNTEENREYAKRRDNWLVEREKISEAGTLLGKNSEGEDIYEGPNGVRYIQKGNIRHSEPVAMIPTRGGIVKSVDIANRGERYKTVEEMGEISAPDMSQPWELKPGTIGRITKETADRINEYGFNTKESDVLVSDDSAAYINNSHGKQLNIEDETILSDTISAPSEILPNVAVEGKEHRKGSVILVRKNGKNHVAIVEITPGDEGNSLWNFWKMSPDGANRYLDKFRKEKARIVQSGGWPVKPHIPHDTPEGAVGKPEGLSGSQTETSSFENKIPPVSENVKEKEKSIGAEQSPHDSLSREVQSLLAKRTPFDRNKLFEMADKAFGGTLAENKYSAKDAYDAMEMGVNRYINENTTLNVGTATPERAQGNIIALKELTKNLPTQTTRTEETDKFQQFSTPPALAYFANWLAKLSPNDVYLEPSAGTGGLVTFANTANVGKIVVNELSPRRADILRELGYHPVFMENAEQINNIFPKEMRFSVVVMNPPFSATAGRLEKKSSNVGFQHIEQALKRLLTNGRLVAILGEKVTETNQFAKWLNGLHGYTLRADIGIGGKEYQKYGTTYGNQVIVIDRLETDKPPVKATVDKIEDAIDLVKEIRDERADPGESRALEQDGEGGPPVAQDSSIQRPPILPATGKLGGGKPEGESGVSGGKHPGPDVRMGSEGGHGVPGKGGRGPAVVGEQESKPARPGVGDTGPDRGQAGGEHRLRQDEKGVKVEKKETEKAKGDLTDSVYEQYTPQKIKIAGSKKHPGKLVESAAMSVVAPPDPTYSPSLPKDIIQSGKLSDAQLESVVYAGQSHKEMLPDGKRKGYFIGDGTGVGKGREISGILYDNWIQGRRKAIWISQNSPLIEDAKRDVKGLGWDASIIHDLSKEKIGEALKAREGVYFLGYDLLRSKDRNAVGRTRVSQLVDWFGKDYDGVIIYDEAHNMGNALAVRGRRGTSKPSEKALAGVQLQQELPNARVVYVSATGATEVMNLSYADRLGLWGEGTPFANKNDFVSQISSGGIAAMELVARDMKAMGNYTARSLSYDDVKYEKLEHKLTPEQRDIYNALAEAWQMVLRNINQALEATDGGKSGKGKSAALAKFWGAHQRFFNQIITSLQTPAVVRSIEKDLRSGDAVIIQIVNTNESDQQRAISRMEESDELEDLDLTPRAQLMEYVRTGFPVAQYHETVDDNGNTVWTVVVDSAGNPVENADAVAMREELLDRLGGIRVPDPPLEMIINHFGVNKVAEITGRTRRVVNITDAKGTHKVEERRSKAKTMADADAYMADKKPILIFSYAGGTGRSYHADLAAINQRKRRHYLLQAGWRADRAIQGFGRSHRTNQKQAPEYVLVTTDIIGQKRFISSIARRLDQLGALTRGQRETGSGGFFTARDNLESQYAQDAIERMITDIYRRRVPEISMSEFVEQTGLELIDKNSGALNQSKIPTVGQFLNRLLSMKLDMQEKVFNVFSERLDENIRAAMEDGTLDVGLETLKAKNIKKLQEQTVHTDVSGAHTKYVELEITKDAKYIHFKNTSGGMSEGGYVKNIKSGQIWATGIIKNSTNPRTGEIDQYRRLIGPKYSPHDVLLSDLDDPEKYQSLTKEQASDLWDKTVESLPKTIKYREHLVTGTILPIWDRLDNDGGTRIMRVQTEDGERMIGRLIDHKQLADTLKRLGATASTVEWTPEEVFKRVKEQSYQMELANGWKIVSRKVAGNKRIEVIGTDYKYFDELKRNGAFTERISWETRVFIPTTEEGIKTIEAITKTRPIINAIAPVGIKNDMGLEAPPDAGTELYDITSMLNPDVIRRMARKAIKEFYIFIPNRADVTLIQRLWNNPHFLAKKHPQFKAIYERQLQRDKERLSSLDSMLKEKESIIRLTGEPLEKLKKVIWKLEGRKVTDVEKFTYDDETDMISGLNQEHYEKLGEFVSKRFGAETATNYISLRKSLDMDLARAYNKMKSWPEVDEGDVADFRKAIGEVQNYFPHHRYGKYYIRGIGPEAAESQPLTYNADSTVNEGRWRLKDPRRFDKMFTITPDKAKENFLPEAEGVNYIMGVNKSNGEYQVQAIRFKKDLWPEEKAAKWWEENKQAFSGDFEGEKVLVRVHYDDITAVGGGGVKGKRILDRLKREYPNVTEWQMGKNDKMPDEIYSFPIPVEAMQQVIDAAIAKMPDEKAKEALRQAMPEAIADVLKTRGWGAHMVRRQDVPGFETEDIGRVLYDYTSGLSGWLTKMEAARDFSKLLRDVNAKRNPGIYTYSSRYIRDVLANSDRLDNIADSIRGALYLKYIALNFKTGVVNLTQNIIAGVPRLSMDVKWAGARYVKAAMSDIIDVITRHKTGILSAEESRMVKELYKSGVLSAQYTQELKGMIVKRVGVNWSRFNNFLGLNMSIPERFNRVSLAIAAFRAARDGKIDNQKTLDAYGLKKGEKAGYETAKKFAEDVVNDAHFVYGKANLPEWARGGAFQKLARVAYTLRTFSHNILQLYEWMAKQGGRGWAAIFKSMVGLIVLGGLSSVPFYKTLLEWYRKRTGRDPQAAIREMIPKSEYGSSNLYRDLVLYGAPSAIGPGLDIGGSLGIELSGSGDLLETIVGVPASAFKEIEKANESWNSGQKLRAVEDVAPTFARNVMAAQRMATEGQYTTKGKPVNFPGEYGARKISAEEAIAKSFGFNPVSSRKLNDMRSSYADLHEFVETKKDRYLSRYTNALNDGDLKEMAKIREEVQEWNSKWQKEGKYEYFINLRGIRSRIKNQMPERMFRGPMREMKELYQ